MTKPLLVPCPTCSRHVRVVDAACPFCRSALPASLRNLKGPEAPRMRLSRAALFALTASAAAATTACGGMSGAMYGAPGGPIEDTDGGETSSYDSGSSMPAYGGGPGHPEVPIDTDASETSGRDGGSEGGSITAPSDGGASDGGASDGDVVAEPNDAASAYDGPMAIASYGLGPIDHDAGIHVTPLYGAGPVE